MRIVSRDQARNQHRDARCLDRNVMGDDFIAAPGACVAETFRAGSASEYSRYALCARSHAV
jgi:hypothetical protein